MHFKMTVERLAIVLDFDGTILTSDASDLVLRKFTGSNGERHNSLYGRGLLSYEDYRDRVDSQFSTIAAGEVEICSSVLPEVNARSGFGTLLEFCSGRIPVNIASLGVDFLIRQFLQDGGWYESVVLHSPAALTSSHGIRFEYPGLQNGKCESLKDDTVDALQKSGMKVLFAGDGASDHAAASLADYAFAVRGSTLAGMCRRDGMGFTEFDDFFEIVDFLRRGGFSH